MERVAIFYGPGVAKERDRMCNVKNAFCFDELTLEDAMRRARKELSGKHVYVRFLYTASEHDHPYCVHCGVLCTK